MYKHSLFRASVVSLSHCVLNGTRKPILAYGLFLSPSVWLIRTPSVPRDPGDLERVAPLVFSTWFTVRLRNLHWHYKYCFVWGNRSFVYKSFFRIRKLSTLIICDNKSDWCHWMSSEQKNMVVCQAFHYVYFVHLKTKVNDNLWNFFSRSQ